MLAGCLLLALGLQAHLALVSEANWDEFHYLAQVHEHLRGELALPLQTLHVHLFAPLAALGGGEVTQIVRGRLVMLGAQWGTLALLYALARNVLDRSAALLTLIAYATLSNTLAHGASFRVDPLAGVLVMGGLVAVTGPLAHPGRATAAVLAPALATMVTVKAVLYAPAFLAVLVWRLRGAEDKRGVWVEWLALGAGAACAFAILYLAHGAALAPPESGRSTRLLSNAATVTLLESGWFPRLDAIGAVIVANLSHALVWVAGLVAALLALARPGEARDRAVLVLGLCAVTACLAVYRNAFPYFFPFILPPAMVAVGWGAMRWLPDARVRAAVGVVLATFALGHHEDRRPRGQDVQRDVLASVHAAFPRPVPVIDRNGMVASFPREGFFMSGWGLRNYWTREEPIYREILARRAVPLLVLNSPFLRDAVGAGPGHPSGARLLADDVRVLRENFVHHAPFVWVAGKRLGAGPRERLAEFLVPGRYRLEARGPVRIDGRTVEPGGAVQVERGALAYDATVRTPFVLKWDVAAPGDPAPTDGQVYTGF